MRKAVYFGREFSALFTQIAETLLNLVMSHSTEGPAKYKNCLFFQGIYNEKGNLVEIHEKFPSDKGHQKAKGV